MDPLEVVGSLTCWSTYWWMGFLICAKRLSGRSIPANTDGSPPNTIWVPRKSYPFLHKILCKNLHYAVNCQSTWVPPTAPPPPPLKPQSKANKQTSTIAKSSQESKRSFIFIRW
mmetsp:Transcript_4033/g.7748  ORF Transcript_4033/g.7748 Transcript_4033/m.7748 type:complete len:114 (-) Transcript_4033:862-1203(-)